MNNQFSLHYMLNQKFLEYKAKNPAFSVRALAKKLGLQPSATNEILKGQRGVSYKLAEKIADRLLLDPTERMNLLKDFPRKIVKNAQTEQTRELQQSQVRLASQQFELFSDWTYYAILNLMDTRDFISNDKMIAERLGLTEKKVRTTLDNLLNLNLIKCEDGQYKRTHRKTNTSDDVLSLSIQKMHLSDMEMAKEKMSEVDVKLRDFTSYTLAFDIDLLPKVKELIRRLQDDVDELMQDSNPTEVYKMNTYLYPLTKVTNKHKQENLQ